MLNAKKKKKKFTLIKVKPEGGQLISEAGASHAEFVDTILPVLNKNTDLVHLESVNF